MKTFLKIKIKSLAAEQQMIRKEEIRFRGKDIRQQLYEHRMWIRPQIRSANLAYGFLRGRTYKQLEATARTYPDISDVVRLVEKYGRPYLSDVQSARRIFKKNHTTFDLVKSWIDGDFVLKT